MSHELRTPLNAIIGVTEMLLEDARDLKRADEIEPLLRFLGEYTVNQAYLRDRTFAEWVAHNQLVTAQLAGEWPSIGRQKGEAEMPLGAAADGGREWRWVMQVTQTPEEDLRRLDIDVYPASAPEDADPSASLSGFIGKPK